jgi:hypothetical protein
LDARFGRLALTQLFSTAAMQFEGKLQL